MYGYDTQSLDDPCIKAADEAVLSGTELLLPGANFIDIVPAIGKIPAWVPGAYSVRAAARVKRLTEEMIRLPMEHAKKNFVSTLCQFDLWCCIQISIYHHRQAEGKAIPSLVTDMLEKRFVSDVSQEEEEAVENIACTVYSGKCMLIES